MSENDYIDDDQLVLEDGEWEEGVVYVDEDGNEFTVEFVYEDEETDAAEEADQDSAAQESAGQESTDEDSIAQVDTAQESAKENARESNPFTYDAVQSATDAANEIYKGSAGTARDLAAAGHEMKETLDDIKGMFNFKDMFKL